MQYYAWIEIILIKSQKCIKEYKTHHSVLRALNHMLTVLSINLNLKKYCSTWAQEETAQEQFKDYLTNNLTKDNLITVNNKLVQSNPININSEGA